MTHTQDQFSWFQNQRALPFLNASGETAPARAVMQVSTRSWAGAGQRVEITKPDGSGNTYCFNGPADVANNGQGLCYFRSPVTAKILSGTATNAIVGPVASSWELSSVGEGYRLIGARDATSGFGIAEEMPPPVAAALPVKYYYLYFGSGHNFGNVNMTPFVSTVGQPVETGETDIYWQEATHDFRTTRTSTYLVDCHVQYSTENGWDTPLVNLLYVNTGEQIMRRHRLNVEVSTGYSLGSPSHFHAYDHHDHWNFANELSIINLHTCHVVPLGATVGWVSPRIALQSFPTTLMPSWGIVHAWISFTRLNTNLISGALPAPVDHYLQIEDGSGNLLLENGDSLIFE